MGDVTKLPERIASTASSRQGKPITRVTKAMRRQQIITLLLSGRTEVDIAKALGMTPAAVSKIVLNVLDSYERAERASVEKVRALQLARIDELIKAHWNDAVGVRDDGTRKAASLRATAEIRNLEQLRARIVGTEAAREVHVSGSLGFKLETDEVERADQAWLQSGGDVVEGTAVELASGDA